MTIPAPSDWVCRWPVEPRSVSHWVEGGGRATVLELSDQVLGFELVGHVPEAALDFLHGTLDEHLTRGSAMYVFSDSGGLESVDPEIREELVKLMRIRRSEWSELHVLTQSALMGMTVAAVALILGSRLHSYRSRDKFMAALERVMAATSTA